MSDFHQAGVIATLHRLGPPNLEALEAELEKTAAVLTVAIALFPGLEEFPWGQIAAASLIVTLPVIGVVLILQRRIVAGLTAGALGG